MSDANQRYLELVKRAVLDDLYLEHELRIEYLFEALDNGRQPDLDLLRDPLRQMRVRAHQLIAERNSGHYGRDTRLAPFLPLTVGRRRLDAIDHALERIQTEQVPGDIVVVGAGRGGTAVFVQAWLLEHGVSDRTLWVVDEFRPPPGGAADLNAVRDAFDRFDVMGGNIRFLQGDATRLAAHDAFGDVALLQIGASGPPTAVSLATIYSHVSRNGFVFVDDAADSANVLHDIGDPDVVVERLDASAGYWRKGATAETDPHADEPPRQMCDLSVVVVFYNMRREAARTLHSLSRAYQEGIEDLDYEVIVVENGSASDQNLGDVLRPLASARSSGTSTWAPKPPPPPSARSTSVSTWHEASSIAVMIDGAHVLTPGVLRFGMVGLRTYAPALVATQQWYVGPGQQPQTMLAGYDQSGRGRVVRSRRLAERRLPALRHRSVHRGPRLVRRPVGKQLLCSFHER